MNHTKLLKAFTLIFATLLVLTGVPHIAYADTNNDIYSITEDMGGISEEATPTPETDPNLTSEPTLTPEPELSPTPVITTVTGILLDKATATLMVGDSLSLLPTINPIEATDKSIIWSSSNNAVAIVDEAGTINAISQGTAVITVTTKDGGFSASCSINVFDCFTAPGNEFATPQNYDTVKLFWSSAIDVTGYEVWRANTIDGVYSKIATVQTTEFVDKGLNTGAVYFYKVRAYKSSNDAVIYSYYTQVITVKTLDKTIGSSLFLYLSDLNNRNSVFAKAVELHNGDSRNTCALTVSEAFRRLGMKIPTQTMRTNQVESHLAARGYKRQMNLNLLQPGDIAFTTDSYGNYLGGHSTHTFIFMGWANKEKTLMNIVDNQSSRYGSVLHTRTIFNTSLTDATAFFYHTDTTSVGKILKLSSTLAARPVTYNKVKITWDVTPGAYAYKIYRATSKYGAYHYIGSTSNMSYTDTSLTTGKAYYYKVRAYSYIGSQILYGSYSDVLTVTPMLSVPTAIIKPITNTKAKLSWNQISGASGYQIYRSTTQNGSYTRVASTSDTSYTNANLVSGKNYFYKLCAYRYVGNTKVYSNYSYINLKGI